MKPDNKKRRKKPRRPDGYFGSWERKRIVKAKKLKREFRKIRASPYEISPGAIRRACAPVAGPGPRLSRPGRHGINPSEAGRAAGTPLRRVPAKADGVFFWCHGGRLRRPWTTPTSPKRL